MAGTASALSVAPQIAALRSLPSALYNRLRRNSGVIACRADERIVM